MVRKGAAIFDVDTLIVACRDAAAGTDPRGAIRDVMQQTLSRAGAVQSVLGRDEAGISILHTSEDLTVLNVVWAPHMTLWPHEHRMWAAIGIYGGAEENLLYRRGTERIQPAGTRLLDTGDVFGLGADAIHSVHNPRQQFTGAIHVYGGDFVNQPRSQWDPDSLDEQAFSMDGLRSEFAKANEQWREQLGLDLDEQEL